MNTIHIVFEADDPNLRMMATQMALDMQKMDIMRLSDIVYEGMKAELEVQ